MTRRVFLFLQGVCSPFFARLADRLIADGHRVIKINFTAGDVVAWAPRNSVWFRQDVSKLTEFLDSIYINEGVTDQVLFGDRRQIHRPAVTHGEVCGVRTHVFEEGYFRPFWITLEREGVNGHSLLPRDPDWFFDVGSRLPDYGNGQSFRSKFWRRAGHDIHYHLWGLLNPLLFPRYRTHASVSTVKAYAGYALRFSRLRLFENERSDNVVNCLISRGARYYLLPLQLNSDAQIRDHSRFNGIIEVIEYVMISFEKNAPGGALLVIKNHPLDNGVINYRAFINKLASALDIVGRVLFIESGDLLHLLNSAVGVVTVNSTVGALSLQLKRPTISLSDPIYNLPGLTFQGTIDAFWESIPPPDEELFRRFRNTVIHTTQVNGGFYCPDGIALAVKNSLGLLADGESPLERLLK